MSNPQIIFLDEPTLGVDVQSRSAIWEHVIELKKKGIVILLTTNYMEEADYLADTLAIIDHGKLIVVGSPAEIKTQAGEEVIEITAHDLPKDSENRLLEIQGVNNNPL